LKKAYETYALCLKQIEEAKDILKGKSTLELNNEIINNKVNSTEESNNKNELCHDLDLKSLQLESYKIQRKPKNQRKDKEYNKIESPITCQLDQEVSSNKSISKKHQEQLFGGNIDNCESNKTKSPPNSNNDNKIFSHMVTNVRIFQSMDSILQMHLLNLSQKYCVIFKEEIVPLNKSVDMNVPWKVSI
jgi:hypothetical protein